MILSISLFYSIKPNATFLAYVGRQTSLSNGCVIGAKCEIHVSETLPEGTLFYGSGSEVKRRVQADKPSVCLNLSNFLF